jgi:hypothetical protein
MKSKPSFFSGQAGFCLLCLASLLTLTSCGPTFMGPGSGGYGAYAPAYGRSNYLYYPHYQTYYHPQTNMYHYRNGNNWMSGPRPFGVTHNVIRSSPSVPLYLNSHPQYHHNNVMNVYPHNWNGNGYRR